MLGAVEEMLLDLSALPQLWAGGAELVSRPVLLLVPLCCVLQVHGFVVYHTQLPHDVPDPAVLGAPPHTVCDRAYVMLQKVSLQERTHTRLSLSGRLCPAGVSGGAMSHAEPLLASPLA